MKQCPIQEKRDCVGFFLLSVWLSTCYFSFISKRFNAVNQEGNKLKRVVVPHRRDAHVRPVGKNSINIFCILMSVASSSYSCA